MTTTTRHVICGLNFLGMASSSWTQKETASNP